jgi:hypothetical protein
LARNNTPYWLVDSVDFVRFSRDILLPIEATRRISDFWLGAISLFRSLTASFCLSRLSSVHDYSTTDYSPALFTQYPLFLTY